MQDEIEKRNCRNSKLLGWAMSILGVILIVSGILGWMFGTDGGWTTPRYHGVRYRLPAQAHSFQIIGFFLFGFLFTLGGISKLVRKGKRNYSP